MERLRHALRNPEGQARKTLERASTGLILLALVTVPLAASLGTTQGRQRAINWVELVILGFFTAERGPRSATL